jgi:hypothetical protein
MAKDSILLQPCAAVTWILGASGAPPLAEVANAKNDWTALDKMRAAEYANNADRLITPKKSLWLT